MAYPAVISLDQTIQRLLDSPNRISISSSTHKKLKNVQKPVKSLKELLKRMDGSSEMEFEGAISIQDLVKKFMKRSDVNHSKSSATLTALDGQIRDAFHTFEDILDFHLSDKFLSHHKRRRNNRILSLDLDTDQVWQGIKVFAKAAKKLEEEFAAELDKLTSSEEVDDEAEIAPSYTDFGVEIVGFSNNFTEIKEQMLRKIRPSDFAVFSIFGVAGTGRSAAARSSFDYLYRSTAEGEDLSSADGSEKKYFDCGAWASVGQNYQIEEIVATIIAQINESNSDSEEDEEDLYASLEGRRYVIVLDDVCDAGVWDQLRSLFPEEENGSVVLLTTCLREVAVEANSLHIFEMSVFDEKESWGIVEQGVFGGKSCPAELEEAGKKIAKNCKGRRIALAKAVLLLLKAEQKAERWKELAADEENQIFKVADELAEICIIEDDMAQLPCSTPDDQTSVITDMIALSGYKEAIEDELFPTPFLPKMEIIYILGMAGIGKTKLAKQVIEDPDVFGAFDNHVWLTLGPKYKSQDIVQDIIDQISPEIDTVDIESYPILAKKWLIVLDDVWHHGVFDHLSDKFPEIKGKVLVTTRLQTMEYEYRGMPNQLFLLNSEESWSLFCRKVFGKMDCPLELEKPGKKIVENCEGLPLLILTVADAISKSEDWSPEFWNILAKNKQNPLFLAACDEVSKVLYPSYEHLQQYLRAFFLYMGAFPRRYEIPTTKLINLSSVEGFLEPRKNQRVEKVALGCVHKLNDQNLTMVGEEGSGANAKTYALHTAFWHLANRLAAKSKFIRVLDSRVDDDSVECENNQRRLCLRNVIALIDEDVYNSLASSEAARSLLCFGPLNIYPVPINLGLRLLRVLDALTIRFYEFPADVVELAHLRYLALTCDGNLPSSISKLWFLHFLIVHRYHSVRSTRICMNLPLEIWDMKELRHLQVSESSLLDPADSDADLPNLSTLLDVSVQCCTEKILGRMPNLKKLGIRIELAPRDASERTFHCLKFKSVLRRLKSLRYVVVNPQFSLDIKRPFVPLPVFSSTLKKLKLSGFGYPWEYMSIIGKLQNLKVLKLQSYAFCGAQWDTGNDGFRKLEYLSIEDSDLVNWNVKRSSFPELRYAIIKHCYKLKELPYHLSNSMVLIEVIDCNPIVVKWAKQMEEKETKNVIGSRTIGLEAHSSWEK